MKRLPAEWEESSFIQLVYPPIQSDWKDYFDEIQCYYDNLIETITKYEDLLLVVENEELKQKFANNKKVFCEVYKTNDTWARDTSAITIYEDNKPLLLNFNFDGWGNKFDARLDNAMTKSISKKYSQNIKDIDIVLEGGAIESNGEGIILATTEAVLNPNRQELSREDANNIFINEFGAKKILWIENGYLSGDDTDSHIDTLARFIKSDTIAYVKCDDINDEHYEALKKMEEEIKSFTDLNGEKFKLVELPFVNPKYYDDERLPATYANFLFVNGALLVPIYDDINDDIALNNLQKALPNLEVKGIESTILTRQHGSLHCISMQFPKGVNIL